MSKINYYSVDISEDKKPKKYNYMERRAEMLRFIEARGFIKFTTQSNLAKKYDVSQQQISRDIKSLKEFILDNIGNDVKFKTNLIYEKVILDLIQGDNKDKYNAAKLLKDWNDWLFGIGAQEGSESNTQSNALDICEIYERVKEERRKKSESS
jgi:hypothetical protein